MSTQKPGIVAGYSVDITVRAGPRYNKPMKYSLRTLMIAVLMGPPLLAWGWWGWDDLQQRSELEVGVYRLLKCPTDDFANTKPGDGLSYGFSGGRINPPNSPSSAITATP